MSSAESVLLLDIVGAVGLGRALSVGLQFPAQTDDLVPAHAHFVVPGAALTMLQLDPVDGRS